MKKQQGKKNYKKSKNFILFLKQGERKEKTIKK